MVEHHPPQCPPIWVSCVKGYLAKSSGEYEELGGNGPMAEACMGFARAIGVCAGLKI